VSCVTVRALHRRFYTFRDGLFERLDVDGSGGSAGVDPRPHQSARLADSTDGGTSSGSACPQLGAIERCQDKAKISAYAVRSSLQLFKTISPISSPTPSTATSSASSIAARYMGSTPATVSRERLAGIPIQTRIGLQTRADDITVGLSVR